MEGCYNVTTYVGTDLIMYNRWALIYSFPGIEFCLQVIHEGKDRASQTSFLIYVYGPLWFLPLSADVEDGKENIMKGLGLPVDAYDICRPFLCAHVIRVGLSDLERIAETCIGSQERNDSYVVTKAPNMVLNGLPIHYRRAFGKKKGFSKLLVRSKKTKSLACARHSMKKVIKLAGLGALVHFGPPLVTYSYILLRLFKKCVESLHPAPLVVSQDWRDAKPRRTKKRQLLSSRWTFKTQLLSHDVLFAGVWHQPFVRVDATSWRDLRNKSKTTLYDSVEEIIH